MEKYSPQNIETKWYNFWEEKGLFSPDQNCKGETYSIVIPPPNVTGSLHIGHALVNTLQDVLIRWKRMSGYKTLWLPGTDHAGIATQMIVERELRKKGIEREEIGREKFVEEIWKWKEQSGNMIFKQLRRLGASLDWSRERFTLDEGLSAAVRKTFVNLYEEGLIYRGNYIVNWCPKDKTALSDLEVDHKEKEGTLTYIAYPLEDGSGELIVATTRVETMLGDTAVAVNPKDPRYSKFIGKKVLLPLVKRLIPVIADEFVDIDFGTGAVKVTPAHDPNDFAMGQRHKLPSINIFTTGGEINEVYPDLKGMDRFDARKAVTELLKKEGIFRKVETHTHAVGHCQRCSTVVEPRLSTQWFCKMDQMASDSLEAMEKGEIRFIPDNQGKIFKEWMTNIQDWCLSRQIWWGHRIPAWYCKDCDATLVSEVESLESCTQCGSKNIRAETDVLDTWFSSGLFPFSTMGWPEKSKDLEDFYPNSTLVTGYDILFFWVARMIMLGMKQTGKVPFPEVFLHGLVRDEKGEKMSKTKGNVIDPLDLIEVYGADSLRFTLISLAVMGKDIKLPEKSVENSRNFINKIWNATKFTLFHTERLGKALPLEEVELGLFDRWILQRLQTTIVDVNRYLKIYRFDEVAKTLYTFVWKEFCDWYLEIIKPVLFEKLGKKAQAASLATLQYVLEQSLLLLHPLIPFVTEELRSEILEETGTIMVAPFPKLNKEYEKPVTDGESFIELVKIIRNIRGENNIKPDQKIDIQILSKSQNLKENLTTFQEVVVTLAGLKSIEYTEKVIKSDSLAGGVGKEFEVYVDLKSSLDVEAESKRLGKEKEKLRKKIAQLSGKLKNASFLEKAPKEVIEKNQIELKELSRKLEKIEEILKSFSPE